MKVHHKNFDESPIITVSALSAPVTSRDRNFLPSSSESQFSSPIYKKPNSSVVRSVGPSAGQSVDGMVGQSVGRSVGRSFC